MAERSDGNGAEAAGTPAPQTAAEALDDAAHGRKPQPVVNTSSDEATGAPVKTAADIVKENEARKVEAARLAEQAERDAARVRRRPAAERGGGKATATATRPVVRKTAAKKTTAAVEPGKGRTALTAANKGLSRVRNTVASGVWLLAVLCAVVLALGALFTALSQTNDSNEIVTWVLARGADLAGPFGDLFKLETAKNTLLVNWGIAGLAYLVAGKIIERVIRP